VLGEEIPIQETRGYVKRVLRTYGVYRWLYRGETPALPLAVTPAATARR
jgi:soluble lytic murein transglycosylase-like protein